MVIDKVKQIMDERDDSGTFLAHTCEQCQEVVIQMPSRQMIEEARSVDWLPVVEVKVSRVLEAASNGCAFFQWTIAKLKQNNMSENFLDDNWSLSGGFLNRHIHEHGSDLPFIIFHWLHQGDIVYDPDYDLDWPALLAEQGDPAAQDIYRRPASRNIASKAAFNIVRGWLNDCQNQHPKCKLLSSRTMPSTILEISWVDGACEPSLRIVAKPHWENYAALSYCWGGDQPIKATEATIHELSQAVPFSKLPKSLQDAVLTTWELSMRYLWIDSLCIIQDDLIKTAREIALMPQIYENAYITISAARSSNSYEGFLHDVSAPSTHAKVFRLPYLCADGTVGSVIVFVEPESVQSYDPIERRAWPLQEFLLSRRVLKYGSYQMSWSCLSNELYENETSDAGKDWWHSRDKRFSALRKGFHRLSRSSERNSETWKELVKEYTSRDLSDPKDRLVAISGIATALGESSKDPYLAGLWLSDFPSALLWEIASPLDPRPTNYRAPSWSWGSVDGLVAFPTDLDPDPDLKLVSYSVTPVESAAPYGAVMAGHIEIIGRLRPAQWVGDRETLVDIETGDAADGDSLAYATLDFQEDISSEPITVWCLQICPYDVLRDLGPYGLILATTDEKVCNRLGTFSFDPGHYKNENYGFYSFHREKQQGWADGSEIRKIIIE